MPNYADYLIGDKKVKPSGFKRGFFNRAPFYNGTDINFDVFLIMPYKKNIDETINLEWEFINQNTKEIIKQKTLELRFTNIKKELKVLNTNKAFVSTHDRSSKTMEFQWKRAIQIGRRWDFEIYDLTFKEPNSMYETMALSRGLCEIPFDQITE